MHLNTLEVMVLLLRLFLVSESVFYMDEDDLATLLRFIVRERDTIGTDLRVLEC